MKLSFNTRRASFRHALLASLSVAVLAAVAGRVDAASQEAKVKTAYLYTFLSSVTWPDNSFASDDAPYVVVIVGEDKLEGLIDKVAKAKKVNKRSIELKRVGSVAEAGDCHLLYVVGELDEAGRKAVLDKTSGTPALVVGETANFASEGAAVNFYIDADGKMGFQVNQGTAESHGLKLGDKILKVGDAVN